MNKTLAKLNKHVYVGVAVLDMSEFHYDYIKRKFKEKATLLFADADSLCYSIKTNDLYKDMKTDSHKFDFNEYDGVDYRSQDNANKNVIGAFKDETNGTPITEFVGLRSKVYSVLLENDKEKKTAGKCIKNQH